VCARRIKLHPIKAIVVKIKEAARLHSEMKQELKEGGSAAQAISVEIQILRQVRERVYLSLSLTYVNLYSCSHTHVIGRTAQGPRSSQSL
jgi:hypothetical protein